MRRSRPLIIVTATAASVVLALPASPATAALPATHVTAGSGALPARAIAQIDALARAKASRSATERKVGSSLLTEATQAAGAAAAAGVARVTTGVQKDGKGRAEVDIAGTITSRLLQQVKAAGGTAAPLVKGSGLLHAALPVAAIVGIAALPEVRSIRSAARAMTDREASPRAATPASKGQLAAERERQLTVEVRKALAAGGVRPLTGSVDSEGDRTHRALQARGQFKVTGVGVMVCVLSDGVDSLAGSQATGDLPPGVLVLPGQAGSGDEGTAMLEIVHDLAPGASLGFATAFAGEDSFAQNIRDLRSAGCDIIVDDVFYFDESPFQDGPVARAVIDVTNDGALYFSSAGNEGNADDHTSGVYEGDFVDSGQTVGKFVGEAHDFDPGPGVQPDDPMSVASDGDPVTLFWTDPMGAASDDYDLYIIDSAGNVAAFSNDVQNGSQDPFEITGVPFDEAQYEVVVVKFAGADRFIHVNVIRGRFQSNNGLTSFATTGETKGHSAVPAAFSVAAVPAADPLPFQLDPSDPPNPGGPFPGAFKAGQKYEPFTSDGPRRVFFRPDGTPITPGNFSATGGTVRHKPDLTAADGVSTSLLDFTPFFGTSAAAPHAAAIAALLLSGNPGMAPATVRAALTSTSIDIAAPGFDRDTGAGIVMASSLLKATGVTPQPLVVADQPTVTPTAGDGDQFFEPGETGRLKVPLTDIGDGPALGVSAMVTTTTAGATITPSTKPYGSIGRGGTDARNFTIKLAPGYEAGVPVVVNVHVTFTGALSPTSATFKVPTGQPSSTVVDFAYTGPPVPIPDADITGVDVPVVVSGIGRVSHITFSIDGAACSTDIGSTTVGLDHTFVSDLVAELVAPDGTQVLVWSHDGGDGNNICQAVFDDSAGAPIAGAVSDDAPFTGSWQPVEPLASLVGAQGNGTWTLHVADTAAIDTGSVRAFSLHLSGYEP